MTALLNPSYLNSCAGRQTIFIISSDQNTAHYTTFSPCMLLSSEIAHSHVAQLYQVFSNITQISFPGHDLTSVRSHCCSKTVVTNHCPRQSRCFKCVVSICSELVTAALKLPYSQPTHSLWNTQNHSVFCKITCIPLCFLCFMQLLLFKIDFLSLTQLI